MLLDSERLEEVSDAIHALSRRSVALLRNPIMAQVYQEARQGRLWIREMRSQDPQFARRVAQFVEKLRKERVFQRSRDDGPAEKVPSEKALLAPDIFPYLDESDDDDEDMPVDLDDEDEEGRDRAARPTPILNLQVSG